MIVLVSHTASTYKAQIRSSLITGFKALYNASCTMGEEQAAKAVVRKHFSDAAAATVRQVIDQDELREHIGDFKADPQRKQVFTYWAFDQRKTDQAPSTKNKEPGTLSPSDPRFEAARKHAETARRGLRLTVAACLALGLELLRLKDEIGAKHGGARWNDSTLPWKELVARETGFCYERCQDFMKAAKGFRDRIGGSRKKGDAKVKLIVQTPPAAWTDADYDAFAEHLAGAFEADSFKALMLDLFPVPAAAPPAPPAPPIWVQDDFYQAMMAAHDCVAAPILGLHRTQLNPAEFVRYVYDLPLEDLDRDPETGRPPISGLLTLRHILTTAGEQIDQAIKAKGRRPRAATLPAAS